jgi:hypothetical protein
MNWVLDHEYSAYPTPMRTAIKNGTTRSQSRQDLLVEFRNDGELCDLCFDMNMDYEGLNGENKADKARELIAFCERRQVIADLVARCRELRPNTSWEGEYELAQDLLLSKPKSV